MGKKFKAKNMEKLDSPLRKELLPPDDVLKALGLKEGDYFLDAGAAIGYFSLPASKIVGNSGKVFATDISKEMLDELKRRTAESGAVNVAAVLTKEYEMGVSQSSIDTAFTSTVLHEIDDKKRFLTGMRGTLKKGGLLAVLEWIKKPADMGPPEHHRCDEAEVTALFSDLGLTNIETVYFSDNFYLVTGTYEPAE